MDDIQQSLGRIKDLIREGKSEEEVSAVLFPTIEGHPGEIETIVDYLAEIPHETTARVLRRLLERSDEKKVRKEIRRVLYRMRSKGVPVSEASPSRGESILKPPEEEPSRGYATAVDQVGQRLLVLTVPHSGRGWFFLHGVPSDTEGLNTFLAHELTRKEAKGFLDRIYKESPFPLVEMEAAYVAFLFSQAYRLTIEKKKTPPEEYLRFKGEIERLKRDYERPLIYSYLSFDESDKNDPRSRKGSELLKEEPFATWRMDESLIEPYIQAVEEAQASKLFLNPSQKEVRLQEIYLNAVSEIFSEERKALYVRRIEETSYVLYKLGKEEAARTALSVASDLKQPFNPIQPNPFAYDLVVRSIQLGLAEAKEKKEEETSLILKP